MYPIGKLSISRLPAVYFDGEFRVLACLPETTDSVKNFPKFGSRFNLGAAELQEIDLQWYNAPILDQGMTSSCFPAGTLIVMGDGSELPIEEVGMKNTVLTHSNKIKKVTETFKRKYTGTLYSLKIKGWSYPLRLTAEHPLFILDKFGNGKWVEAKNVKTFDKVLMSYGIKNQDEIKLDVRDFLVDVLTCNDKCRLWNCRNSHSVKYDIKLDNDFARLVGLFLAEGSHIINEYGRSGGIRFTFASWEENYQNFVIKALHDIFGVESHIKYSESRPTVRDVECLNTTIGEFFLVFCGRSKHDKFVNPIFFKAPESVKINLLRGWLDGDGLQNPIKVRKNKSHQPGLQCDGVTVSPFIHRDAFRLSLSCNLKPGSSIRKQEEHQTVPAKVISFYSNDVLKLFPDKHTEILEKGWKKASSVNYTTTDFGFGCNIKSITQIEVKDLDVYNLEVDGDNSYVANCVGVHNCVGHGATSGMEYGYMQSGAPLVEFNPYFVYGLINGGKDAGAMISDALKALQQYGTCLKGDLKPGMMFKQQFPQQAFTNAAKYKLENAFHCQNFEEICAAISLGFVCPLGIYVDQGFSTLDSEGVASLPRMGGGGHCVTPQTFISGPTMNKAKDIKVGDVVYGHDGKQHVVEEIFKRYYNGNLVKINAIGCNVTTTEEHPILVYRRVKKNVAVKATAGFIDYNVSKPFYKNWEKHEMAWINAKDVKKGDYLVTPKIKLPEKIEMPLWLQQDKQATTLKPITPSKDLAWLFGYFIGDGSTYKRTLELIFAAKDVHLVAKAISILKELGVNPKIHTETKTYIKIRVTSSVLAKSFREWFGAYSHEKHVPEWLLSQEWNAESLLEGLMDSDGCIYKNYNIYHTTSERLSEQVKLLAIILGNRPSSAIARHSIGTYPNARTAYVIKWINGKQKVVKDNDDYVLYPVKTLLLLPYSGDVYNFEVADSHSYLAKGVAVHNCILGMGLKKSARYGWLIKIQNSWGIRYGMNGFAYIHKGHFQRMQPDAFAIQTVTGAEDNTPVVPK